MKAVEISKSHNPKDFEDKIYSSWVDGKCFGPQKEGCEHFSVVMPPPNVTGILHMGHALNNNLQDIIVRYQRMQGKNTLWVPGTDHAGIATQNVVERQLAKEGLRRQDLGREKFIERTWEVKHKHHAIISSQLKKMGCSCDWDHERFTMDEGLSKAVREAFVTLYERGLIYKGKYLVNYCPKCGTALADDEVEYENMPGHLYDVRYPYADGSGYITVATTRPETMFGDVAVAVNPDDERYKSVVGKKLILPLMGKEIPIIADAFVDKEFGTGMVKITPAHDPNDWECGKRHNLEAINLLNPDGTLNENVPEKYRGLDPIKARELVVADLQEGGYLVGITDHAHDVGHCYRCHTVVEPYLSEQWFVSMRSMADKALAAWKNGDIQFYPKRWENTYTHWMENIRDWCISRQLWWGHRIPAYYCDDCGETIVSKTKVDVCPKCGGTHIRQDEDVLDTWFSSALWPFSTLGFPKKTKNLEYFYPTNVLVTGYDIIFFWVARMMFSGLEFMHEVPFSEVLIHGLVRDAQGRKMSKSLGNGIDPLEIIDKYGADALRFSLATGIAPGSDTRFTDGKIESCRNFVNKLWNASRFVILNIKDGDDLSMPARFNGADKWILTRLNDVIKEVTINLNKYELGLAAARLYDFVWSEFCDWYIEMSKTMLYSDDKKQHNHAIAMLAYVLTEILKLLHPFMPFVTEEIYSKFAPKGSVLMVQPWPAYNKHRVFRKEEASFEGLREMIGSIRNLRNEMNVVPSKKINAFIIAKDEKFISTAVPYLQKLAGVNEVTLVKDKSEISGKLSSIVTHDAEIFIPLGDLIDEDKEKERINAEIAQTEAVINKTKGLLSNAGFTAKAPQKLIDNEKEKLEKAIDKLAKLRDKLAMFD